MKRPQPLDPRLARVNRLQQCVHSASWWLMGQGLLFCWMGVRTATLFKLRFDEGLIPYLDVAGLGLLCFGLFINRAVREASKQYLAVDTLTLYFVGLSAMLLTHRVKGFPLFWFEWLSLAVNVAFGTALIAYRTKGTQMNAPGTLVALDVKDAWTQAMDLARGLKERKPSEKKAVADVIVEEEKEEAPRKQAEVSEEVKGKAKSQAMPHMD